ncbi:MAG: FtsQ-type POTRA domain-containing protein [Rickettsiales bacterium]|jgi:cell division protein FtsQ|nr:FtsQ-type POTRA domain-containing protein [Rickettsiales bacterium]
MQSRVLIKIAIALLALAIVVTLCSSDVRKSIYDFSNDKLMESGFVASDIVINDLDYVDKAEIVLLIRNITFSTNILFLNLRDIEKQILNFAWVKDVSIKSNLSNGLGIEIIEHQPKAFYQTKSAFNIVDSEVMVILTVNDIGRFSSILPQLVGEGALINAKDIITLLMLSPDFYNKIQIIERVGKRRWDLTLHDGIVVKLPEHNVKENWEYFLNFEQEFNIINSEIKSIDLRTKDRLFIEFSKDLKDIKILQ